MEVGGELILDTDVLILLVKEKLLDVFQWKFYGYITTITLYEYVRGRAYFGANIESEKRSLEHMFTILNITNNVVRKICEIYVKLRHRGILISDRDLINGAIAITNDLPFCTNNIKHYKRLEEFGLNLISWTQLKPYL